MGRKHDINMQSVALLGRHRRIAEQEGRVTDHYDIPPGNLGVLMQTGGLLYSKGKHRKSEQWRVVKEAVGSNVDGAQWRDDIAAMQACDHPHISKLFECYHFCDKRGEHRSQVLEFCLGKTLKHFCNTNVPEVTAALMTRQIVSAIGHLHSHGFCHLELGLESFMLTKHLPRAPLLQDICLKLMDVGQALAIGGRPRKGLTKCGRDDTAAPELTVAALKANSISGDDCDMYAVGIISFFLLSGAWPIVNSGGVIAATTKSEKAWCSVSYKGTSFVKSCLCLDPKKRPPAAELLEGNAWMAMAHAAYTTSLAEEDEFFSKSKKSSICAAPVMTADAIVQAFKDMANMDHLQRAVITAAVHRLPEERTAHLRRIFHKLDANGNGTLSVEELVQGLGEAVGRIGADEEITRVLEQIDTDGNRSIDYTEFLAATFACKKGAFRDEICEAAFSLFDGDGSGKLSLLELTEFIGLDINDDTLSNASTTASLLDKYDTDGDGTIDVEEFKRLLKGDAPAARSAGSRTVSKVKSLPTRSSDKKGDAVGKTKSCPAPPMQAVSSMTNNVEPEYSFESGSPNALTSGVGRGSWSSEASIASRGRDIVSRIGGRASRMLRSMSGASNGSGTSAAGKLRLSVVEKGARVKQKAKDMLTGKAQKKKEAKRKSADPRDVEGPPVQKVPSKQKKKEKNNF